MTEEQKKYIKELRDKMLAEGASNDAIKFAINDYLYKESLKTSEQESTSEPTSMEATLTDDTEADVISTGANIVNPDYWDNVESNPNDWEYATDITLDGVTDSGYRNTVTGEVMVSGSMESAMWDDDQMALWEQLELNNKLKEQLVSKGRVDKEEEEINTYWDTHSANNPDVAEEDVIDRSAYNVTDVAGEVVVKYSGDVDKDDPYYRFMDKKAVQNILAGVVVTEDDPVHGETVAILKREHILNKNKRDIEKKQDKDDALSSMPSMVDTFPYKYFKSEDNATDYFKEIIRVAGQYGFLITDESGFGARSRGQYHRGKPCKVEHIASGKTMEWSLGEEDAKLDAFMREHVEARQNITTPLLETAVEEIAPGNQERAEAAQDEVLGYVAEENKINDTLTELDNTSEEELAAENAVVQQEHEQIVLNYINSIKDDPDKKEIYSNFIKNGGSIENVPTEFIWQQRSKNDSYAVDFRGLDIKDISPSFEGQKDFLDLHPEGQLARYNPEEWRKVLLMSPSEVKKYLLEDYKKHFLTEFETETDQGVDASGEVSGLISSTRESGDFISSRREQSRTVYGHLLAAKKRLALQQYLEQSGINDPEEIARIRGIIFAPNFDVKDLDQFSTRVEINDGEFTTIGLDTIFNDIGDRNQEVISNATTSLATAKDEAALISVIEQQVRDMDYKTWQKGEVQEVIASEVEEEFEKVSKEVARQAEASKIVNDKYVANRELLEANLKAREEVVTELNEITSVEYETQEEVDEAQGKLDVLKEKYDALTIDIQGGLNANTLLFNAARQLDSELQASGLRLDNVELYSKYINQNFAPGTRMLWNAASAAVDLIEGGVEALGMVNDLVDEGSSWILKGLGCGDEVVEAWCGMNDYIGLGGVPGLGKANRNTFHSWVDNWQEEVESGLGRSIAFNEIGDAGDFGLWFGNMFASQVPNLALMYATGGASLYVMGATSAGSKYKELREQDELYESTGGLYGNNYTFAQMFSTSLLVGGAEALSEKITLGQMTAAKTLWKGMSKKQLKEAMKPGVYSFFTKNVVSKRALKEGAIETLEEGGSEVAATLAENLTSRYIIGDKNVHILDGVAESFVSGALISRTIGAFGLAGEAVNTFSNPDTRIQKDALTNRNKTIMQTLAGGGDLLSMGRPSAALSEEQKEALENELVENQAKLDELIELDIKRIDNMTTQEKGDMIQMAREELADKNELSELLKNKKLTEQEKQNKIDELTERSKERAKNRGEIIKKYPPEDVEAEYKANMEIARAKEKAAQKAGKDLRIEEGNTQGAADFIAEMEGQGFKVAASQKDGQFYGVTAEIKNDDGTTTTRIFINSELAMRDGMVATAAHEFMHATLYNTVMQDPGVRAVLGAEARKILNGPGVTISPEALEDLERLDQYSPEEVGEELFAIVSEHLATGAITINDSAANRFKGLLNRIFNSLGLGVKFNVQKAGDKIEGKFNTTEDVREFLAAYAKNIRGEGTGEANVAIENMLTTAANGTLIDKGRKLGRNQRSEHKKKMDFSKARDSYIKNNPEQAKQNKKRFDDLTQNEDGSKKWENKDEWDVSSEKWDGFSLLDNSNEFMDNLIMSGMASDYGVIRSEQDKRDFIKATKEELQDRYHGGLKKTARNKLDKVKEKLATKEITPAEAAEQIEAIENDTSNYRKGFDPTKANGSLFGWLTGGSGNVTESTLYRARGDVMKAWNADPNRGTLSLDAPIGEQGETFGSRLEGRADTDAGVDATPQVDPADKNKVWQDLGFKPEVVENIKSEVSNSGIDIGDTAGFMGSKMETVGVQNVPVKGKDGKPVLNKKGKPKTKTPTKVSDVKFTGKASGVLQAVSNEFGVDARKVPTGITLKPVERNAILDKIAADPTAILNNIPDQHTRSGKATGVQQVLLDALFEEAGYRGGTKAATAVGDVGMDAQGLPIFNKKTGLDEVMLMAALGVEGNMQDGKFVETGRYDTKKTTYDSILKGIVSQVSALATNQAARAQAIENNSHPTDVIAEFGDGKNELSFSILPEGAKGPKTYNGQADIMLVVDMMRSHPNLKLNPEQAVAIAALQLGVDPSIFGNAAAFIESRINEVYEGKPWEDPNLAMAIGRGLRTLDVEYADNWSKWANKTGYGEILFDKTNQKDRAEYHKQTVNWLQTLPTAQLDNAMGLKAVLSSGSEGDFYYKAEEVDAIVAEEKARRERLGNDFTQPTSNVNWAEVKFDPNLMNKIEEAAAKHVNVKDPAKRQELILRDANKVKAKSTSNPEMNNKALDEMMGGFNSFINATGITQAERNNRAKFVATTMQDQTSRSAGLIRGAAAFNAMSMSPGTLHYKSVSATKRRALAAKLGVVEDSKKASDPSGDGKLIGADISGAKITNKDKAKIKKKKDAALKKYIADNNLNITPTELEQQLFDEFNEIKTRHGEHDIALMLFTTTVFDSMMNKDNKFYTTYPLARKYYSQTALNEDLRVEVDKAWGKTGNAPGYFMGMPGYIRFIAADSRSAMDILDLEAGSTVDKVIAADIALNNIAGEYGPIVDGARQIMTPETINQLPKALQSLDTRVAFNEVVGAIANSVYDGTDLVKANAKALELVGKLDNIVEINKVKDAILQNSNMVTPDMTLDDMMHVAEQSTLMESKLPASEGTKGASVWDFDDTLATTKSNVIFNKDGETKVISAEDFATQGAGLIQEGWTPDFSEFNKVTGGKPGPMFDKAMDRAKRFGTSDTFILTARAPQAQMAIHEFLKGIGLNIPIQNIVGLGNSTGAAKAQWIQENIINEGYNDIAFADDALQNVDAVAELMAKHDVKSKVQQAKLSFSLRGGEQMRNIVDEGGADLDSDLNIMLEGTKGVGREKRFSPAKARKRGKNKGRFKFFIPASADDFAGLCYAFFGKGKKGEQNHAWFKEHLFDPFAKGIRHLKGVSQLVANEIKDLKKTTGISKQLKQTVSGTEFTLEDAIRVYNWTKAGYDIPGLSETDKAKLIKAVESDPNALAFANGVNASASKAGGIVEPGDAWEAGTITSDMSDALEDARSTFLAEWIANKDIIFSPENLNKIEAVYGTKFREALEDMLWRMENGGTRNRGKDRLLSNWMTWLHGSVGATMFFNARSALLQQLSNVNFINWHDNNPIKAAAAFANQKQYWTDVAMIFNSDFLKQRRGGIQTDVNARELLNAMKDSKNPMKSAIAYLLRLGFTPTQIGDSIAIATGGSTMYRNRVQTYLDQGMNQSEAESQAFEDMMEIAEETQQSTREDKISQQQASPLGKLILAFQNTPMQYNRLIKKAALDLVNGRGDTKTHISKIIYYGAVQNLIFYGLQQALFAAMFGDDEEDEIDENKKAKLANGMLDSLLRGSGLAGAVVSTVKNVIIKFMEESEKMTDDKFYTDPDWANVIIEGLNVSPPIGIKARKLHSSLKTWEYNDDIIKHMDKTDIDNPMWEAIFNATESITNAPTYRLYNKFMNIREAMDNDNETWQRVAMLMGWSRWSFGIQNQDVVDAKGEVKEIREEEKAVRREAKKQEREAEKQAAAEAVIEEHKVDQQEKRDQGIDESEITCAAVNKSGKRCGKIVLSGQSFCTIHEGVPQQANETQCSHVKANGDRCKMKTKNQSGKCYYHD